MTMRAEDARKLIGLERRVNGRAVELATHLSLAVRVEVELIRAMRLAAMPDDDAGVEADLWFSSLVQTRDVSGLVFIPEVRQQLLMELSGRPEDLETALAVIEKAHGMLDEVVLLEERATYYGLRGDAESRRRMQLQIGSVVRELVEGRDDPGLLSWVARMMPRLPESARMSEAAVSLRQAASDRLGGFKVAGVPELPDTVDKSVAWTPMQTVRVGIEVLRKGVRLHCSPSRERIPAFEAPRTRPVAVEVGWPVPEGWKHIILTLETDGTPRFAEAPLGLLRLRNITGGEVLLRPEPIHPRLVVVSPSNPTGSLAEPLEEVLRELQWSWEVRASMKHPGMRSSEGFDRPLATLYTFEDREDLERFVEGVRRSWKSQKEAVAGNLASDGQAVLVQVEGRIVRLKARDGSDFAASAGPAALAAGLTALSAKVAADVIKSSPDPARSLRKELLEIEALETERWAGSLLSTQPGTRHAVVLILWENYMPRGMKGGPELYDSYVSRQKRLVKILAPGGTLWVVASRKDRGGRRMYQLAYRLEDVVEDRSHPEEGLYRVRARSPEGVTHFPPEDATSLLQRLLRSSSGHPLEDQEAGAIGRRLQSIVQLGPEEIEVLEEYAESLLRKPHAEDAAIFQVTRERDGQLVYRFGAHRLVGEKVDSLMELLAEVSSRMATGVGRSLRELLYRRLCPPPLDQYLEPLRPLTIVVDERTARFPWELLQSPSDEEPLAIRSVLTRQMLVSEYRMLPRDAEEGSSTPSEALVAAGFVEHEQLYLATREAKVAAAILEKAGFKTRRVLSIKGEEILTALYESEYAVIHLAGRGVAAEGGLGLDLGGGMVLSPLEFRQMRKLPRLLYLDFLTEHWEDLHVFSALMKWGVRHLLLRASRHQTGGEESSFTNQFYRLACLDRLPLGEAVLGARRAAYSRDPGRSDWAAIQYYGEPDERLRAEQPG